MSNSVLVPNQTRIIIDVPDRTLSLTGGDDWTYLIWVKPDSDSFGKPLVTIGAGAAGAQLYSEYGRYWSKVRGRNADNMGSADAGQWTLVGITYSSDNGAHTILAREGDTDPRWSGYITQSDTLRVDQINIELDAAEFAEAVYMPAHSVTLDDVKALAQGRTVDDLGMTPALRLTGQSLPLNNVGTDDVTITVTDEGDPLSLQSNDGPSVLTYADNEGDSGTPEAMAFETDSGQAHLMVSHRPYVIRDGHPVINIPVLRAGFVSKSNPDQIKYQTYTATLDSRSESIAYTTSSKALTGNLRASTTTGAYGYATEAKSASTSSTQPVVTLSTGFVSRSNPDQIRYQTFTATLDSRSESVSYTTSTEALKADLRASSASSVYGYATTSESASTSSTRPFTTLSTGLVSASNPNQIRYIPGIASRSTGYVRKASASRRALAYSDSYSSIGYQNASTYRRSSIKTYRAQTRLNHIEFMTVDDFRFAPVMTVSGTKYQSKVNISGGFEIDR